MLLFFLVYMIKGRFRHLHNFLNVKEIFEYFGNLRFSYFVILVKIEVNYVIQFTLRKDIAC